MWRDAIRLKHYSIRTKEANTNWIKRCIYFHNVRHPAEMAALKVQAFLTHLAVEQKGRHHHSSVLCCSCVARCRNGIQILSYSPMILTSTRFLRWPSNSP